jgi:hypothetical protein
MSACPFIVSRILDYAISPSPPVPWDVPSERLHRGMPVYSLATAFTTTHSHCFHPILSLRETCRGFRGMAVFGTSCGQSVLSVRLLLSP